jgi:anion-transporting  ArsA/GET3 family ATPase
VLLDRILDRRLVVLSGKGGVGKSVVGAALGLAAARRGKKVLLIEVDAPLEAARRLGAAPAGSRETEVRPGLFTLNMRPRDAMDDYVRHVIKIEAFARRILDSPVYERFYSWAPGLKELMLLGKIMVTAESKGRGAYDLVLFDAPATGHGLSMLKVPEAAATAIPVGPIGNNARRVISLLRDHKRCTLVMVTIPEEMAVVEALELQRVASDEVGIHQSALVMNACHERRFSEAEAADVLRLSAEHASGPLAPGIELSGALGAARRHLRRRKMTRFYQARLRKQLPDLPLVSLPYLHDEIDEQALLLFAERLEQV